MEECRSQFWYHNSTSRWTQIGDRCMITCCMRNENGEFEMDPNAIWEIATKFYVALLSEEPMVEDIRQNRMKVWTEI